jgi:arylsulfatase A-like enzyme
MSKLDILIKRTYKITCSCFFFVDFVSKVTKTHKQKHTRTGTDMKHNTVYRDSVPLKSLCCRGSGRQKRALKPLQPTGLAVNLTTLPQQLGNLGYQTHMVGKWHLGKTGFSTRRHIDKLKAHVDVE